MTIIRVEKNREHPYSMISNSFINDGRISLQALGLGVYFLSKMDQWKINIKHLMEVRREGRDALYAIVNELKSFGYMRTDIIRDEKGQFVRRELVFCEDACLTYSHSKREENKKINQHADSLSHPDPDNPEVDDHNTAYPLPGYPDPAYPDQAKPETYINTKTIINTKTKQILKDNPPTPQKAGASGSAKKEVIEFIFSHWQKIFNHPKSRIDQARSNYISRALRMGYSQDDLVMAIDGCAKTPHNCGINERGQLYDGIHVIFKDADQIDRFIRNCQFPPQNRTKKQLEFHQQVNNTMDWSAKMKARMEQRENAQG